MNLGRFDDLLADVRQALREGGEASNLSIQAIEVRVVFFYRTHDQPLGAQRRFYVHSENDYTRISPETSRTHQLLSRSKRHQAEQWYMCAFGRD